MTLLFSEALRAAHLEVLEEAPGLSPRLVFYAGTAPASADDQDPSQPLVTMGLPADWMDGVTNGTKTKLGTWEGYASASGIVQSFRIKDSTGNTCWMQGTVSDMSGTGDMRMNNQNIRVGQKVRVSTFVFQPWPVDPTPFPNLYVAVDDAQLSIALSSSGVVQNAPGVGIPISADFLTKSGDPRGGDCGYVSMARDFQGNIVVTGGFSHNRAGNNAVAVYNPVANEWTVPVANKTWVDDSYYDTGTSPWDARAVAPWVGGAKFFGNRDNQIGIMVDDEYWILDGQRGQDVYGNFRGILDCNSHTWEYIDDGGYGGNPGAANEWPRFATERNVEGYGMRCFNASHGYVPGGAQDRWVTFGGGWPSQDQPNDTLMVIERSGGTPPFTFRIHYNRWGGSAFSGSPGKFRYTTHNGFGRNGKWYIYGGKLTPFGSTEFESDRLYEITLTNPPSMTLVSTNNLAVGKVYGNSILVYHDATRDFMVATNGLNVNVYNFADDSWNNVPVNTAYNVNRLSPSLGGAGRQCAYSPEIDQLIILGGGSSVFGLRLNYQTTSTTRFGSLLASLGIGLSSTAIVVTEGERNASLAASLGIGLYSTALSGAPGSLLRTVTPMVLTGPIGAKLTEGDGSKHLQFSYYNGRHYKMAGDHKKISVDSPDTQSGRQEIISFVPTNINSWAMDQPYYIYDPAQIQMWVPDDAFSIVRNDEIWVFQSVSTYDITAIPLAGSRPTGSTAPVAGHSDLILAWNPVTKLWRVASDWRTNQAAEFRSDRAWRAVYDAVSDKIFIPCQLGGLVMQIIRGSDGADLTNRVGGPGTAARTIGMGTYGNINCVPLGCVFDAPNRIIYIVNSFDGKIYTWNVDTEAIAYTGKQFPDEIRANPGQNVIKIAWHPVLRLLIYKSEKAMKVYDVDRGTFQTFANEDGYTNSKGVYCACSDIFYDPDTGDMITIGGMDWDTGSFPELYWRTRFTRT